MLLLGACVPDFAFRDGTEATTSGGGAEDGGDGGDGGRKRTRGDGGGSDRRPTSGIGVTSATSTGQGAAGSSSSTNTGSSTASGGEGGAGGVATGDPTSSTSSTTTTTSSTGGSGTVGVPCWDGYEDDVVTCSGSTSVCCADTAYFDYDQCGFPGDCGEYAWEFACNENADCGNQLCCVNTYGDNELYSIECASSCDDFEACDPAVGCGEARICIPIFDYSDHPEYDAYGFCQEP